MKKFIKYISRIEVVQKILLHLFCMYVKLVVKTIRWTIIDKDKVPDDGKVIFILWHNRIILGYKMWSIAYPNKKTNMIVSPSIDGEILKTLSKAFGHNTLVGSSGSGTGSSVFRNALKLLKSGKSFVVSPDGSRGPRYHIKRGTSFLLNRTGTPALLVTYNVSNRMVLNSWDNLIIPKPFCRGVIMYDLVEVKIGDDTKKLDAELEKKLIALTQKSDLFFNHKPIEKE